MELITPTVGKSYRIRLSNGRVAEAVCTEVYKLKALGHHKDGRRLPAAARYVFRTSDTKKLVILRSRVRIVEEVNKQREVAACN